MLLEHVILPLRHSRRIVGSLGGCQLRQVLLAIYLAGKFALSTILVEMVREMIVIGRELEPGEMKLGHRLYLPVEPTTHRICGEDCDERRHAQRRPSRSLGA